MLRIKRLLVVVAALILTAFSVSATTIFWTSAVGIGQKGVFKVDTKTKVITNIVDTGLEWSDSILIDPDYRFIYNTDPQSGAAGQGRVHRWDDTTKTDTVLATGLYYPQDMAFEPDRNHVLVSNYGTGEIFRIDVSAGASFPNSTKLPSPIPGPNGIAFDNNGNLFIFGGFGTSARLYWLGTFGQPNYGSIQRTSSDFDAPDNELDGLTFDPVSGHLFGTSRKGGKLWKINPAAFIASQDGTYTPGAPWATGIPYGGSDLGPDGVITNLKGQVLIASRGDFKIWSCNVNAPANCGPLPADDGTAMPVVNGVDDLAQIVIEPPVVTKSFSPTHIAPNGISTLTITITNPNANVALLGVAATDTLPTSPGQVTVANPANASNTCGGTFAPAPGATSLSLTGGTIPAGGSCQLKVNVTAPVASSLPYHNIVTTTSSNGGDGKDPGTADLYVDLPLEFTKSFNPPSIPAGGTSTASFTINNPNPFAVSGVGFTDSLPAGMSVASPVTTSNNCGSGSFNPALVAGATSISFGGLTMAAGPNASCTITVNVTATTLGGGTSQDPNYNCAVLNGAITACAPLIVTPKPPVIVKSFVPNIISPGGTSTLTFTISNPNPNGQLTGIAFTDTLPAGLIIANPPAITNTCGGTFLVQPTISLTNGGPLAAGNSCVVSVNVTGANGGSYCNITGPITATGVTGVQSNQACLTITTPGNDVFQIRYAANLDVGDAVVVLTNAGSLSGSDPEGRLCVNVYAFAPTEEMISCCSCMVTPNGLASLSVNRDIMSAALTGVQTSSVVIKLLASKPSTAGLCDPTSPNSRNLVSGMRAWGTSLHPKGTYPVTYGNTETEFLKPELSPGELSKLTTYCQFMKILGSNVTGICKSCQSGALGAVAK